MGMFDGDKKYEELKRIREVEGYKGPLDQDLKKVEDLNKWIADGPKKSGWTS